MDQTLVAMGAAAGAAPDRTPDPLARGRLAVALGAAPGPGPEMADGLTPALAAPCWCIRLAALEPFEPASDGTGSACPRPRFDAALAELERALSGPVAAADKCRRALTGRGPRARGAAVQGIYGTDCSWPRVPLRRPPPEA